MTDMHIKSGVYNCPNCGAAATPESVRCTYCHSSLATLVCSKCFGAIFVGMKHCPWCGENASAGKPADSAKRKCPRCDVDFLLVSVSKRMLSECPACGGLWLDNDTLQQICTDQEQQQAVMGFTDEAASSAGGRTPGSDRTYVPCPECNRLMNRRQFASCSGVIVDWCKAHGTWFDRNELKQVVQFILAGGLNKAREREKMKIEEERQALREEERNLATLDRLGRGLEFSAPRASRDSEILDVLGGIWRSLIN